MSPIAPVVLSFLAVQQHAPAGAHAPARPHAHSVHFAVIGDYGTGQPDSAGVATLVASWRPDFVLTTGDNNYPNGAQSTIDANIGQFYSRYIFPYAGTYPAISLANRFFPALGNHDWIATGAAPYLNYFTLPGNERYYDVRRGPVHFFALDSDPHEPDGILATSTQAVWLQSALAVSDAPFKIVYFHHPPFSSALHGNTYELGWPFRAWGADLVLSGHDHDYERVDVDGFPYIVDGSGGNTLYDFRALVTGGSEVRQNYQHGALLVDADARLCTLRFIGVNGAVEDQLQLRATPFDRSDVALLPAGSTWKYKDDGSNQGSAWIAPGFDDSSWASGPAQLGYGDGDEATTIDGGPSSNHFVTTYFRKTFLVASPGALRSARLELVRDDGAAVYVNGQELLHDNLAANATSTTFALAAAGADENEWHPYDLDPALLVAGANTIAVEVHQSGAASSDVSFDLRLTGYLEGTLLLARGSTWRYLDSGVDPGPGWEQPGFADTAWPSGAAELGYGEGDEATLIGFGPDPLQRHTTSWFRTHFSVANPAAFQALELRLKRDDAAIAYLNGRELLRWNLPLDGVSSAMLARRDVDAPEENAFLRTLVDASLLVSGVNTLAVEVHQSSPQSDDLSFDLELAGF